MSKDQSKKYSQEFLDETNESKHAIELLKKAAEMVKPYGSECLGSFSINFWVGKDLMTGRPEAGFATLASELNLTPEAKGMLLEAVRDTVMGLMGATLQKLGPKTMAQIELEKEEIKDTMPR